MTKIREIKKADEPVKKNCVLITLQYDARYDALEALVKRGLRKPDDDTYFGGPDFKDIKGYQITGSWFIVNTKDGAEYAYPNSSIARLKFYSEE